MKSNVISFKKGQNRVAEILSETEKVAVYNGLNEKETLRLRLLTEEISGVVRELVNDFDGEFWIENEEKDFTVNLSVKADSMSEETKEKLIAVSSTGKNELAKGFMGKLRSIVEFFAISSEVPMNNLAGYYVNAVDAITMHSPKEYELWSLDKYKADVQSGSNKEWDELEKSIVANLADDVVVGVMGKKIKISVKKSF